MSAASPSRVVVSTVAVVSTTPITRATWLLGVATTLAVPTSASDPVRVRTEQSADKFSKPSLVEVPAAVRRALGPFTAVGIGIVASEVPVPSKTSRKTGVAALVSGPEPSPTR
jgi:hypothetical protein